MSAVKVIDVLSESNKSWEDAAQNTVKEAAKSLRGIRSVYLENLNAEVKSDQIKNYRVNCKINFALDGKKQI